MWFNAHWLIRLVYLFAPPWSCDVRSEAAKVGLSCLLVSKCSLFTKESNASNELISISVIVTALLDLKKILRYMLVTAKSSGITVMRYFVTRYSQHWWAHIDAGVRRPPLRQMHIHICKCSGQALSYTISYTHSHNVQTLQHLHLHLVI